MVIPSGTTSGRASTMANADIVVPGELKIGFILHSYQLALGTSLTSILPSHSLGTTFDPPSNSASAASAPHDVLGAPERTLPERARWAQQPASQPEQDSPLPSAK